MYYINTDGSVQGGNPGGWAVSGFIVYRAGKVVHAGRYNFGKGGEVTNNQAEYMGVLSALVWCMNNLDRGSRIVVRSDSQLVVNQLTGKWNCYNQFLDAARADIHKIVKENGFKVHYQWVPRAKNRAADLVSRCLYEQAKGPEAFKKYLQKLTKTALEEAAECASLE